MLRTIIVSNDQKASDALSVVIRIISQMFRLGTLYKQESPLFAGSLGIMPGFKSRIGQIFGIICGVDYSICVQGVSATTEKDSTSLYGMNAKHLKAISDEVHQKSVDELKRVQEETVKEQELLKKKITRHIRLFDQLNSFAGQSDLNGVKNILSLIKKEMLIDSVLNTRELETGVSALIEFVGRMQDLVDDNSPEQSTFSDWIIDLKNARKGLFLTKRFGLTSSISIRTGKTLPEKYDFEINLDVLAEAIVQQAKEKKSK
ncbi:hypothetical protein ACFL1Y_01775 [Patescibacteria group bacterium]